MDTRLLTGAVEMLILDVVSHGPSYGYEITQTVLSRSAGEFELKEGSLYPALHRLERQKLLDSYWTEADGRRRKYYKLTTAGRKALAARRDEWRAFSGAVNGVLGLERTAALE
jgi:transcriptional regulator